MPRCSAAVTTSSGRVAQCTGRAVHGCGKCDYHCKCPRCGKHGCGKFTTCRRCGRCDEHDECDGSRRDEGGSSSLFTVPRQAQGGGQEHRRQESGDEMGSWQGIALRGDRARGPDQDWNAVSDCNGIDVWADNAFEASTVGSGSIIEDDMSLIDREGQHEYKDTIRVYRISIMAMARAPPQATMIRTYVPFDVDDFAFIRRVVSSGLFDGGEYLSIDAGDVILSVEGVCRTVRRVSDLYVRPWSASSFGAEEDKHHTQAHGIVEQFLDLLDESSVELVEEATVGYGAVYHDVPLPALRDVSCLLEKKRLVDYESAWRCRSRSGTRPVKFCLPVRECYCPTWWPAEADHRGCRFVGSFRDGNQLIKEGISGGPASATTSIGHYDGLRLFAYNDDLFDEEVVGFWLNTDNFRSRPREGYRGIYVMGSDGCSGMVSAQAHEFIQPYADVDERPIETKVYIGVPRLSVAAGTARALANRLSTSLEVAARKSGQGVEEFLVSSTYNPFRQLRPAAEKCWYVVCRHYEETGPATLGPLPTDLLFEKRLLYGSPTFTKLVGNDELVDYEGSHIVLSSATGKTINAADAPAVTGACPSCFNSVTSRIPVPVCGPADIELSFSEPGGQMGIEACPSKMSRTGMVGRD